MYVYVQPCVERTMFMFAAKAINYVPHFVCNCMLSDDFHALIQFQRTLLKWLMTLVLDAKKKGKRFIANFLFICRNQTCLICHGNQFMICKLQMARIS